MDAPVSDDSRLTALHHWASTLFPDAIFSVVPLAGDASFRRYFRVNSGDQTFVAMDAPPQLENCQPFVAIAKTFEQSTVRFPRIFSIDLQQGFLLLSDFGDRQLLPVLNDETADVLYRTAIDVLCDMQQCRDVLNYKLPHFDDDLFWREFEIFRTWYVKKHMNYTLSVDDENQLKNTYQCLIDSATAQPVVFVHRDYHSRNIMLCDDSALGILDFQDAVWGPITYDLISLLRDCYIVWTDHQVQQWAAYFFQKNKNQLRDVDFLTFMKWFDWMALQRHLKCLGIFSRLHYRDHKHGYLKEMPRVLNYVMSVCDRYPELSGLTKLLRGDL
ncbi:MAG: hypothetical protein A3F13_05380 [Gammaproteobacteria bacterium RIFCSPHIGHO2_12_FULL_40_19]|nr:MAG: hypothetical protein A3F13_05380 [Gammaproteobacteria bacterium RIFCSPHIGHO2_12_FULL_40_19]